MAMKNTIAVIGDAGKICPVLMKKLAQENLRLLFVSEDEEKINSLSQQLKLEAPSAEVEMINCGKEGCWEADIIAFIEPEDIEKAFVERIKSVATQKIVLIIAEGDGNTFPAEELLLMLPHSKVVWVRSNSEAMKAKIKGKDEEAVSTVSVIFEHAGYKTLIF